MIALLLAVALQAAGPEKFEAEIRAFEEWDRKNTPPENPVLFVGSSTIRMWKTREHFPRLPVINRGFGGSRIADVLHYADRIVLPYKPKLIVFYAGENDIADGSRTPEGVLEDFKAFHAKVKTPVIFIGIKPSIKREALWPKLKQANALVRAWCPKGVTYAPLEEMLEKEGIPPPAEWFVADGLHLSDKGYARWSEALTPTIERLLAVHLEIREKLRSGTESERKEALRDAERFKIKEAVPEIRKLLAEKNGFAWFDMARTLVVLGDGETIAELIRRVESPEPRERQDAIRVLTRERVREAIPAIARRLEDVDPYVRVYAIQALGLLDAREYIPAIARELGDERMCRAAVGALGLLGARDHIPDIAAHLKNRDCAGDAITALSNLEARELIPQMLDALPSSSWWRQRSVRAVARLGGPEVEKACAGLLTDADAGTREMAAAWLAVHGSREGVPVLLERGESLTYLNALRSPEPWKKLRSVKLEGCPIGTRDEVLADIVRRSGWEMDATRAGTSWEGDERWSPYFPGQCLWSYRFDAMDAVVGILERRHSGILDGNILRIVPSDEALAFWKEWWESRPR